MDNGEKTEEITMNEFIEQVLEVIHELRKELSDYMRMANVGIEVIRATQEEHGKAIEQIRNTCESRLKYCSAVGATPVPHVKDGDNDV